MKIRKGRGGEKKEQARVKEARSEWLFEKSRRREGAGGGGKGGVKTRRRRRQQDSGNYVFLAFRFSVE